MAEDICLTTLETWVGLPESTQRYNQYHKLCFTLHTYTVAPLPHIHDNFFKLPSSAHLLRFQFSCSGVSLEYWMPGFLKTPPDDSIEQPTLSHWSSHTNHRVLQLPLTFTIAFTKIWVLGCLLLVCLLACFVLNLALRVSESVASVGWGPLVRSQPDP